MRLAIRTDVGQNAAEGNRERIVLDRTSADGFIREERTKLLRRAEATQEGNVAAEPRLRAHRFGRRCRPQHRRHAPTPDFRRSPPQVRRHHRILRSARRSSSGAPSAAGRTRVSSSLGQILDQAEKIGTLADLARLTPRFLGFVPVIVPSVAAAILVWALLLVLLRRAAMRDLAAALQARPPRQTDLEERQFTNVVAEMAIAAGLPPPSVLIVDLPVPNAAAIGNGPADAAVIVTRAVLDAADRDETSAIVAHLVASIGNGDLKLTSAVLVAALQTLAFFVTFVDLPFRIGAWARPLAGCRRAALQADQPGCTWLEIQRDLEESLSTRSLDAVNRFMSGGRFPTLRSILLFPFVPLVLVNVLLKLVVSLWDDALPRATPGPSLADATLPRRRQRRSADAQPGRARAWAHQDWRGRCAPGRRRISRVPVGPCARTHRRVRVRHQAG